MNISLHRRTNHKKWWTTWKTSLFLFKQFYDKQFSYFFRMNIWTHLTFKMLLFMLFISVIQLPSHCSATQDNKLKNNSIEKQISFDTNFEKSSNDDENEIDFEDVNVLNDRNEAEKEMNPWKELKQITSVEYSWSEHINVGDTPPGMMDYDEIMNMADNDIDFYDLLNEINEYYDYYANTESTTKVQNETDGIKQSHLNISIPNMEMENRNMPTTNTLVVDDGDVSATTLSSIYNDDKEETMVPLSTAVTASEELSSISNELYLTTVFPTDALFTDSITALPLVPHKKVVTPTSTVPTMFKVLKN